MTRRAFPAPKLRVTARRWTPRSPHEAHCWLDNVDRDDDESASGAELDDRFGFEPVEGSATYDSLDFPRAAISLPIDDLAREEDTFEVEDREIVIV